MIDRLAKGMHAHCHHHGPGHHHLSPFKDAASLTPRKEEPDFIFADND